MKAQPIHNISSERAMDMLALGLPLEDVYIAGKIKLPESDNWDKAIVFENCIVEHFEAIMVQFQQHVKFSNCYFKNCVFTFSYFLEGLNIRNCNFDQELDFSCGGHNKVGYPVSIINNSFMGFVNFFDCHYEAKIEVSGNTFLKGTNIGSKHQLISFAAHPCINNNLGKIDVEGEIGS